MFCSVLLLQVFKLLSIPSGFIILPEFTDGQGKKRINKAIIITISMFVFLSPSFAQRSITTLNTPITENFNIGTSATASLPTGFRAGDADWSTSATQTSLRYGLTGTDAVTASSNGGIINWGNPEASSSTDRSIGFLSTSLYTAPRNIFFSFTNNTGATISSILISFKYEKFRQGTAAFNWKFYHGQSTANTEVTAGNHSYTADANNNALVVVDSVLKSFVISGLSIANGNTYTFRWEYSGANINAQGLGLDDFSMTVNPTSSASNFFRSNSNNTSTGGSWATTSNWESSTDNINWFPATLVPTSAANTITIRNGHNINISSGSQTVDQLVIDSNATLTFSGGTFSIADGAGVDFIINGIFVRSTTNTFNNNGAISFGASGVYQHQIDGGALPIATWNVSSTCIISGIITNAPTAVNQAFGNVIWNCVNQTSAIVTGDNGNFNPKGLFTVQSTGTNNVRLENAGNGSTYNLEGGLSVLGGTLVLNFDDNGGSKEAIINVTGNVTIANNGILILTDGAANTSITGYMATLNITGDLLINNTNTAYPLNSTALNNRGRIYFTGNTNQNYFRTSATGSRNIDFEVPIGKTLILQNALLLHSTSSTVFDRIIVNGTLNLGANTITQSAGTHASFIVNTGGTIQSSNSGGLGAAIAVGGLKTFADGANYIFNGNTTTPFPTTTFGIPAMVQINATVTSNLASTLVISNALNINSGGYFLLNGNNHIQLNTGSSMTIAANATFDNGGGSQIIVGGGTPTITINGTFITRDPDGFIGSNAAIPTITPTLGSTSSIQYLLSGNQIIQNTTYANLVLGGSGTKTISTNIPSISGTVTIQDAAVVSSGSSVFGGTGTNLVMNGTSRLIVGGNRIVPDMLGAYTLNDGTIEFNGNNALHQIRAGVTYKNVLVSGANVQVESGNINVSSGGSFIVDASANVAFTNQQIIATAASVNVNINGSLSTADQDGFYGNANTTITSANINLTLGANSTIHYNRLGAQMISAFNYANITISGNRSNATITLPSGTVGVSAALVITATNANYIITNDTIHFNGSMAQSIPVLPYNFLRLSNSGVKTLVGNIQCDNGLQVQSGATLNASQFTITSGANTSINIAGTFITSNINGFSDSNNSAIRTNNNTVFTLTNSTIEYNATVAQIVTARNDYHNLTITNSSTKTVNGNIVINGTLQLNSGVFDISNSSLTFQNGNTPISRVSGTITTNNNTSLTFGTASFKNGNAFVIPNQLFTSATPFLRSFIMNRNNSITLNNQFFQLTHRLIISSGELILPTNYTFTLKSTSINNTALVAPVGGSITYQTGAAFVVERFFPRNHAKNNGNGTRAFRDITPSVIPDLDIFNSWQEGGINNNGFGTQITGKAGTVGLVDAITGLDMTTSGNPSLFGYNVSTTTGASAWTSGFAATKNVFASPFKGYRIAIRGNRQNDLSVDGPSMNAETIIRNRGKLLVGKIIYTKDSVKANGIKYTDIRLASSSNTAFTMIGNPYACPIDFEKIKNNPANAGIQFSCWIFDPNIGSSGAYVTYNSVAGTNSNNNSAANKYIQPGQAFFIRNNNTTNPYLEIREEDKAVDDPNNLVTVFSESSNANSQHLRINLLRVDGNANNNVDGAVICYNNTFSKERSTEDALKFTNSTENIAVVNGTSNLSIDGRPTPNALDSSIVRVWTLAANTTYRLSIQSENLIIPNGLQPVLKDRFTKTVTPITFNEPFLYSFTTTSDTNSFNNRFTIVYTSAAPLPVSFIYFKANNNKGIHALEWKVAEVAIASYSIEYTRQLNMPFVSLASLPSTNKGVYQYQHLVQNIGSYYYRIKAIDIHGNIQYSNIVHILNDAEFSDAKVLVYPNPIQLQSGIKLQLNQLPKDVYELQLVDNFGKQVLKTTINYQQNQSYYTISLPKHIANGMYQLNIKGKEMNYHQTVFIQP